MEKLLRSGIRWSASSNVVQKALQVGTILVLTRFLTPSDFGVIATAILLVTTVNLVKELGMPSTLIQRKSKIEESADCFFVLSCTFAVICYIGIFFLARPMAQFFRTSEIEAVVQVMGLMVFVESSSVVQRTLAYKHLRFRRTAIVTIVEGLFTAMVSIVLAFIDYGLWAIVYGLLAGPAVSSLLWWSISDWRPRLRFQWKIAAEILSFGGIVTISLALQTSIDSITRTIVGRVIGIPSLGIYDIAARFAYMPVRLLVVTVTQRVALPAFSKIQDDLPRLTHWYCSILKYSCFALAPLSVILFVSADHLIPVLCGPQWEGAIPIFRVFSVGVFFLPLANIRPIMMAVGRIRLLTLLTLVRFILTVSIVFFSASYGLKVLCSTEIALLIVFTLVNLQAVAFVLRVSVFEFFKLLFMSWKSVFLLIVVLIFTRVACLHLGLQPGWESLLLMFVPAISIYIGSIFVFYRAVGIEFLQLLTGELLIQEKAGGSDRPSDMQPEWHSESPAPRSGR